MRGMARSAGRPNAGDRKARPAGHGAVCARHLNRRFLRITSQVTAITVLRPCEGLHSTPPFRCPGIGQRIEAVADAPHLPSTSLEDGSCLLLNPITTS